MKIRPASPPDEQSIRACARAAYQRYVAAIGIEPAPMVADFKAQIAQGLVHVATDHAELLGYIVFYLKGDQMFLENIAVRPDAAGRGIGKQLLGFCEDQARQAGARSVQLYTNEKMIENLTIYPHLGYREIDRRCENGFHRVYFEKLLT